MTPYSNDRWVPRRVGPTYCSPACGGGCTWDTYERASRDAARLAKRLGPGWKPVVWENLGWFYRVEDASRYVTVRFGYDGYYTASVSAKPGDVSVRWSAKSSSAKRAVRLVLAHISAGIRNTMKIQDAIEQGV